MTAKEKFEAEIKKSNAVVTTFDPSLYIGRYGYFVYVLSNPNEITFEVWEINMYAVSRNVNVMRELAQIDETTRHELIHGHDIGYWIGCVCNDDYEQIEFFAYWMLQNIPSLKKGSIVKHQRYVDDRCPLPDCDVSEAMALTKEQRKLVNKLSKYLKACQDAGVCFYEMYDSLHCYNGTTYMLSRSRSDKFLESHNNIVYQLPLVGSIKKLRINATQSLDDVGVQFSDPYAYK